MRNSWGRTSDEYARRIVRSYNGEIHAVLPGLLKAACGARIAVSEEWGFTSYPQFCTCRKCAAVLGWRLGGG